MSFIYSLTWNEIVNILRIAAPCVLLAIWVDTAWDISKTIYRAVWLILHKAGEI